ncbi:unnamed protein product [Xylocopa violacea]|uniref:Uncharacterized protein n=1 Tax=Xylocopa violacea TaxID=135666 RepID=A0ABP1MZZ2_XYLVO
MFQKHSISLALLLLVTSMIVFAEEEKYTSKYDDINVDEILANDKLRHQYLNCFLETAPCVTADAKYFKGKFPEAFVTKCKKCTEKQEAMFNKISTWYTENDPENWEKIVKKALDNAQKDAKV